MLKTRKDSFGERLVWAICPLPLFTLTLRTLGLILLYYSFSIGITFFQKWFIKDFHFPLTVVTSHLIIKFALAALIRNVYKYITGMSRITLNWAISMRKLAATGVASALDIGFSNWSFEFITISLYTMTKSTCIIFILGFAIFFGLEKKRFSLVLIVLLISSGLFMFTYKSTQFEIRGFTLVLSASFIAGLRWTLAQVVMQHKDFGLSNPVDMMYYVQPWMIALLLPMSLVFEVILPIAKNEETIVSYLSSSSADLAADSYGLLTRSVTFMLIGSLLAFLMELSEFLLLSFTSSLTLSIAGIVKEVFTLYLAVQYNGDRMSHINFIGLVVCLTGICLHVLLKAIDTNEIIEIDEDSQESKIEATRLLESREDEFETVT